MNSVNIAKMQIINRSLSLLRENAVLNIDDSDPSTDTEKIVSKWYDIAKNECIVDVVPTFAIKREVITKKDSIDGYNRFLIPFDSIYIINMESNDLLEGDYILSKTSSDSIKLLYLSSNVEMKITEIKFNICLSYYLAYYISSELTNSQKITQYLLNLKNQSANETKTYYNKLRKIKIVKLSKWSK